MARDAAALAVCSTSAEFCCVEASILATAPFTCSIAVLGSCEAAEISPTMSATFFTELTISASVAPDCFTSELPSSTLLVESLISALISLAAVAERCARLRTSDATTAKPRPCSPARAASTAAFKASKLVWNAIESITPMMSAILALALLISSIAVTACCTTAPPRSATSRAPIASWLAWRALSAFWRTVAVISSIVLARDQPHHGGDLVERRGDAVHHAVDALAQVAVRAVEVARVDALAQPAALHGLDQRAQYRAGSQLPSGPTW